jgi:hypothetical protein
MQERDQDRENPSLTEAQFGNGNPMAIDADYTTKVCPKIPRNNISPSEYELPEFKKRTSKDGSSVVRPIDVKCILNLYGDEGVNLWSKRGDVVARYAIIYQKYRSFSRLCADGGRRAEEESLEIYRDGVKDLKRGSVPSRIPELYYLVGNIRITCGRDGYENYIVNSPEHGYVPEPGQAR